MSFGPDVDPRSPNIVDGPLSYSTAEGDNVQKAGQISGLDTAGRDS